MMSKHTQKILRVAEVPTSIAVPEVNMSGEQINLPICLQYLLLLRSYLPHQVSGSIPNPHGEAD